VRSNLAQSLNVAMRGFMMSNWSVVNWCGVMNGSDSLVMNWSAMVDRSSMVRCFVMSLLNGMSMSFS